jgi:hypothetical protein
MCGGTPFRGFPGVSPRKRSLQARRARTATACATAPGTTGKDSKALMVEKERHSAAARGTEAALGAVNAAGRRVRGAGVWTLALVRRRGLDIATAVAVAGGALMLYAETLDLFRIVTPSGATANAPGSIRGAGDQHSWALGVVGVVLGVAAVLARWTRQRLPAWAAVVLAAIALAIVLIADVPDVTSSGVTTEIESGEANPEAGFWTALVGALLALGGAGALAVGLSRLAGERRARP